MKKAGWYLLAGSLICAFFCDIVFGLIGGAAIGTEAEDWYSSIGCIIGFIAPSIVYFGNKI